jgi:hypothetical protein
MRKNRLPKSRLRSRPRALHASALAAATTPQKEYVFYKYISALFFFYSRHSLTAKFSDEAARGGSAMYISDLCILDVAIPPVSSRALEMKATE